mmetsp:Transcript_20822/g.52488  ORF Transcript_20822/g.52488 Transcript_20822/m.52488 type:complete len:169 (+) Transcript_20822:1465-1971(+)
MWGGLMGGVGVARVPDGREEPGKPDATPALQTRLEGAGVWEFCGPPGPPGASIPRGPPSPGEGLRECNPSEGTTECSSSSSTWYVEEVEADEVIFTLLPAASTGLRSGGPDEVFCTTNEGGAADCANVFVGPPDKASAAASAGDGCRDGCRDDCWDPPRPGCLTWLGA